MSIVRDLGLNLYSEETDMSEERLEHSIALLLARWMGGENLREATEEVVRMARLYYETGSIEEDEL